jgi:hypothetical protein
MPGHVRMFAKGLSLNPGQPYLLPPPNNLPVPHQALPGQPLHLRRDAARPVPGRFRQRQRCQRLASRHEVPLDQTENFLRQQIRADVHVAGVAGAERQRMLGEAVLGHVGKGGRQNRAFGFAEWSWRRGVLVGVIRPPLGGGTRGRARPACQWTWFCAGWGMALCPLRKRSSRLPGFRELGEASQSPGGREDYKFC